MGYRSGDETVEIEATIETSTPKAYLINPTGVGPDQCWLPKSQVVKIEGEGEVKTFTITEWIASRNGLV